MCIIVDANCAHSFFSNPRDSDVDPIHKWINGSGILVYSIECNFANETSWEAKKKLLTYARSGRAKMIPAEEYDSDIEILKNDPNVKSDDYHILALARASGARILYTKDSKLIDDFKNKKLIDKPRGKIYSSSKNSNLLKRNACKG